MHGPGEPEEDGRVPRLPVGPQANRLLAGLRGLFARLAAPAEPMALRMWAAWLDELLTDLGFFDSDFSAEEEIEVEALLDLLGALARSELLTGESALDMPGFLREVDGLLTATTTHEPGFNEAEFDPGAQPGPGRRAAL